MKYLIILSFLFFGCTFAFADRYGVLPVENIILSLSVRQSIYSLAFDEIASINWKDKEKLFLFFETKNNARLFLLDEFGSIEIFQQPNLPINYLLHPKKYIQVREERILGGNMQNCYLKIKKNNYAVLVYNFFKNKIPYIYKKDANDFKDAVLLGYTGDGNFIFIEDLRKEISKEETAFFSKYFEIFSLLNENPFNIFMEKCK